MHKCGGILVSLLALSAPTWAQPSSVPEDAGASWTLPIPQQQTLTLSFEWPDGKARPSPADLSRGIILVKGTVNGKAGWIIVDTGTNRTVVNTAFLRRIGTAIEETDARVETGLTSSRAGAAKGAEFSVTDQFRFTADLAAVDLSAIEQQLGRPVAGILGLDLLENIAFVVSRRRDEIMFAKSGAINPRRPTAQRFAVANGIVAGAVDGSPVRLKLDTGSNDELSLNPAIWDTLADPDAKTTPTTSTDAFGTVLRTKSIDEVELAIGTYSRTLPATRRPTPDAQADGLLGFAFFESGSTLFDLGQNLIVYLPG